MTGAWEHYKSGIIRSDCPVDGAGVVARVYRHVYRRALNRHVYGHGTDVDGAGHCVQLVGYGSEGDVPYWLIRNRYLSSYGLYSYGPTG